MAIFPDQNKDSSTRFLSSLKSLIGLLLAIFFIQVSCGDDDGLDSACGTDNPIENLEWLAAEIENIESNEVLAQYFFITTAKYRGQTVFIFDNCCPFCGTVITVLDCEGELIGIVGPGEDDIDFSLLENDRILWKSENAACVF